MARQRARILVGQVQIASNITYADTALHDLDISAFVPKTCIGIWMTAIKRVGGPDELKVHTRPAPLVDTIQKYLDYEPAGFVGIVDQKLVLEMSVANTEFDIYMHGYITQPPTSSDQP